MKKQLNQRISVLGHLTYSIGDKNFEGIEVAITVLL